MKAMVVYDSAYGNTAQVAEAMGNALASQGEASVLRARDVIPEQLVGLELLIVGSPTQKFRPLPSVMGFLKSLPRDGLRGITVAAFDTRFPEADINKIRILAFFVRVFGYAAKPIADRMVKKGGVLAAPPEGFYVGETKGPLLDGELERAAAWATQIAESRA
jgi:flavodoxin